MRRLAFQVAGQVDDGDGVERALFHADSAADAQLFGNGGDLVIGRDLDAELSHPDDGTGLFALLSASLGFAAVVVDDGDSGERVRFVGVLALVLGRHGGGVG